jgi:carbon-monoxide dehydrogenase large subunit
MAATYIGAPICRREDVRFLTGKARYVDDIKLPQMLHAAILRSAHAHARIESVETRHCAGFLGYDRRNYVPHIETSSVALLH